MPHAPVYELLGPGAVLDGISLRLVNSVRPTSIGVRLRNTKAVLEIELGVSTDTPIQDHPVRLHFERGPLLTYAVKRSRRKFELRLVLIDSRANEEVPIQAAVYVSWNRDSNRWGIRHLDVRPREIQVLARTSPHLISLWDLPMERKPIELTPTLLKRRTKITEERES